MQQITVQLETVLQVLKANNMLNVITKAIEVENTTEDEMPKYITVEIHKDAIKPLGIEWAGKNGSYGYYRCEVVKFDKYKMDEPYLVLKPDGTIKWTENKQVSHTPTQEIQPIQEAQAQ